MTQGPSVAADTRLASHGAMSSLRPATPGLRLGLALVAAMAASACGGDDGAEPSGSEAGVESPSPEAAAEEGAAGGYLASCTYVNGFSMTDECREYRDGTWNSAAAASDCAALPFGLMGALSEGSACDLANEIGRCDVGDFDTTGYQIVSGGDAGDCDGARTGCETFARGTFQANAAACASCNTPAPTAGQPFVPMTVDCRDALDREPAGLTDGKVCTPTIISGSTEPGRRYADYASCDAVRTQRPYVAIPVPRATPADDPRLDDTDYMAELAWLKAESEASACACCHTASDTPSGPSLWDTEAEPIWTDTLSDEGIAMLAGLTDSTYFGFLPSEDNNGFDRATTGLPTTDQPRLVAFLTAELERRGVSVQAARELAPFGPFFRAAVEFEPEACDPGVGIDSEGLIRWAGGGARYLHVLEADSLAPGAPPNWDKPEGTLWAIRVPPEADPMACGMEYGSIAGTTVQDIPGEGPPPALESGTRYFLYVQTDILQPITRCLFTAP